MFNIVVDVPAPDGVPEHKKSHVQEHAARHGTQSSMKLKEEDEDMTDLSGIIIRPYLSLI